MCSGPLHLLEIAGTVGLMDRFARSLFFTHFNNRT